MLPHAIGLDFSDMPIVADFSHDVPPLLVALSNNNSFSTLYQIVLLDVIIFTFAYNSESSSIGCFFPCERRLPKPNHFTWF